MTRIGAAPSGGLSESSADALFLTQDEADSRYLQILNNLSDINNGSTSRVSLGLVAGGSGDIWVEKAGDVMTGNLEIDVETATQIALVLKSTDDDSTKNTFEMQDSDGNPVITFSPLGGAVFNVDRNAMDFNIQGETDDYLFYTDATNNRIGIGTAIPQARLNVTTYLGTQMGLLVQGYNSQTANLFELRDEEGTPLLNVSAYGFLGMGTTSTSAEFQIDINDSYNGAMNIRMQNTSTGTSADTRISMLGTSGGNDYIAMAHPGVNNSYTMFGQNRKTMSIIFNRGRNFSIGCLDAYTLFFGTNNTERGSVDSGGDWHLKSLNYDALFIDNSNDSIDIMHHANGKIGFYAATPVTRQNTTGTTAGFTAGSGSFARSDSTYTGNTGSTAYTTGDIVRALKKYGLLAS